MRRSIRENKSTHNLINAKIKLRKDKFKKQTHFDHRIIVIARLTRNELEQTISCFFDHIDLNSFVRRTAKNSLSQVRTKFFDVEKSDTREIFRICKNREKFAIIPYFRHFLENIKKNMKFSRHDHSLLYMCHTSCRKKIEWSLWWIWIKPINAWSSLAHIAYI